MDATAEVITTRERHFVYDCDDNEDPSHRESFAFPLCLAQVLAVTIATRNPRPGWRNVLSGEVLLSEQPAER